MDRQSRISALFQLQVAIRQGFQREIYITSVKLRAAIRGDFGKQIRASSVELHDSIEEDLLKQVDDDDDAFSDKPRAAAIEEDRRKQINACLAGFRTAVEGHLEEQIEARLAEFRAAVLKNYQELTHMSTQKLRDAMPDDDLQEEQEQQQEEEEEEEKNVALRRKINARSNKLRAAAQEEFQARTAAILVRLRAAAQEFFERKIVDASSEAQLRAAIRRDIKEQISVRLRGRRRPVAVKDYRYDDSDDDDPAWSATARRRRALNRQFRDVGDRIFERLVRLEDRLDGLEDQLKRLSR